MEQRFHQALIYQIIFFISDSSAKIFFNFFFFPSTASNILFLESPAGVGWSYSNTSSDYNCGDDSTGKKKKKTRTFWKFGIVNGKIS